jgi:hypothetical protein
VHAVLENSRVLTVFGPRFGICFAVGGGTMHCFEF